MTNGLAGRVSASMGFLRLVVSRLESTCGEFRPKMPYPAVSVLTRSAGECSQAMPRVSGV